MRSRLIAAGIAAAALVTAAASPAGAVRYGEPDAGEHPYVGLMAAYDEAGTYLWRCSGTLLTPTVFLTAGHCVEEPAAQAVVFFEEDLSDLVGPIPITTPGGHLGSLEIHPDYDPDAFYTHDLGLVIFDDPVPTEEVDEYGVITGPSYFDQFFAGKGKRSQTFEVVGYGLQRNMPAGSGLTEAVRIRLKATVQIINQDAAFGEQKAGNSVLFTNNAATGGTCNGDSGGPIFINDTNVVVAVTSYGFNARCAGVGGGYRIDQPDDQAWLASFGIVPG